MRGAKPGSCAGAGVLLDGSLAIVVVALGFTATPVQPPAWWLAQARCVHAHESSDWHIVNPPYAGGFQFLLSTWNGLGTDAPSLAAVALAGPSEQMRRAWLVWNRDGGSWREWPTTSRICGLLR